MYPRFVPACSQSLPTFYSSGDTCTRVLYPCTPCSPRQCPTPDTNLVAQEQEEKEEARAEGDRGHMLCTCRAAVDSVCVLCVVRMEKSCGASACKAKCVKSRCLTLTSFVRCFHVFVYHDAMQWQSSTMSQCSDCGNNKNPIPLRAKRARSGRGECGNTWRCIRGESEVSRTRGNGSGESEVTRKRGN